MKNFVFALTLCLALGWTPTYAKSAVLRSASSLKLYPDEKSEVVQKLPSGSIVEILQQFNEWSLVEFSQKGKVSKGWIPSTLLEDSSVNSYRQENSHSRVEYREPRFEDRNFHFSLGINPVTLFFPWIEVQLGFQVHPQFRLNVTPQFMSWGYGSDSFSAWLIGTTLSGSIFLDSNDGWYLEPGLIYLTSSNSKGAYVVGGQMIVGYERVLKSGMFMNIGIGAGFAHFVDDKSEDDWIDFNGTYPYPTGNAYLGYRF